jgi:hypothetical protein
LVAGFYDGGDVHWHCGGVVERPRFTAALSAGLGGAAAGLPYKLGIMLAALIGIGVGMVVENNTPVAKARPIERPRSGHTYRSEAFSG